MGIDNDQLNRWCNQGTQETAKRTHEKIRTALGSPNSKVKDIDFEPFLQGSYKNDTNIRGDSDVDFVVKLNNIFHYNQEEISVADNALLKQVYPDATYSWEQFRTDILTTLRDYYGSSNISEGDKAIKIASGPNILKADLIVCINYRKYKWFRSTSDAPYIEGVVFWTRREKQKIISYPKQHTEKMSDKNQSTKMIFKSTVRLFKNARSYIIDKGIMSASVAPSYFIESMIYNVPNEQFTTDWQTTYCNVVNWLNNATIDKFVCPNGVNTLFGESYDQWSTESARILITQLTNLWNNWR